MTISNQLLPIMKLKLNLCLLREQRCYYTLPQYIFVNLFNYVKKIIEAGSKLCVQGNSSTTKCILVRVYTMYEAMTYQSFAKTKKKNSRTPSEKKQYNQEMRIGFSECISHRCTTEKTS